MNRTYLTLSTIAVAALLFTLPALAKNTASGSTVNGKAIPQNQIDFFIAAQKTQGRPDSPELRNAVKEHVIGLQLLVQEAQKQGLDKKADMQAQMDLARQGVLINAYMANFVKAHPISDDAMQKEYDAFKAQAGDKEYKARHILVENEDDAKAIIAKLKKGEKFDSLAAQSKDPGSKDKGGDLGWAAATNYVPPFADALTKLNKGQYTEVPVKSQYGWHVIQLDDSRALKLPAFDEVKPQIQQRMQQQMVERHVTELRKAAKVE